MTIIAKALLFDAEENILVLRRSITHNRFAHHLDFPGGEVEKTESTSAALLREVLEETHIELPPEFVQLVYQKQISTNLKHLLFTIHLAETRPAIELSWEHDNFQWLTKNQLQDIPIPHNVDVFHKTVLRYLAQGLSHGAS